jgi:hypothetical protein
MSDVGTSGPGNLNRYCANKYREKLIDNNERMEVINKNL